MNKSLEVRLPNGKVCYVSSPTMPAIAKILRWEIFKREQHRRPGFELRLNDTVIDTGANIGMFALWAEPQIPQGRLICVEPNPRALSCLTINIRQNDLRNIILVTAAAGSENGTMELVCHPGWEPLAHNAAIDGPWFLRRSGTGAFARWLLQCALLDSHQGLADQPIVVQQQVLSRIMEEHGVAVVNLLKLDCEGSEYEILRSLNSTQWRRIERIVVEYHEFGLGRKHDELIDILNRNGFETEVVRTVQERLYSLMGVRAGKIWARKAC